MTNIYLIFQTSEFSIDNLSGKIKLTGKLDYENVQRYTLFVEAKVKQYVIHIILTQYLLFVICPFLYPQSPPEKH